MAMKLLAIETATESCSAALLVDDAVTELSEIAPRQHTRLILPMVDSLLQQAGLTIEELDAIAYGQGPGAFTGVRIALGVVQGLAFAHSLPVIPISSLAALAQQIATEHSNIAVAIDARMQEIYWGLFQRGEHGLMQPVGEEIVCAPDQIQVPAGSSWYGVGSGWNTYADVLSSQAGDKLIDFDGSRFPLASDVLTQARQRYETDSAISVLDAAPVYLRNKIIN